MRVGIAALAAGALVVVATTTWAASTVVGISVPPTQQLEGTTSHALTVNSPIQRGRLIIKSNIPWTLVANLSGEIVGVDWRNADSTSWQPLSGVAPLLRGPKGIHFFEYVIRVGPGAPLSTGGLALVTFWLAPAH